MVHSTIWRLGLLLWISAAADVGDLNILGVSRHAPTDITENEKLIDKIVDQPTGGLVDDRLPR